MQLIYEILPVFLFFIVFKFYGIYAATVVGIASTLAQVLLTRFFTAKWDKKQLVTLLIFSLFGGLTLYFHNPIFVKWKPTIVFWVFSLVILITHFFTEKTMIQRLMDNVLQGKVHVPTYVFRRLNALWGASFLLLGMLNLYIAYYYDNDVWVNFKFYGVTSALFVLSVIQGLYLSRYFVPDENGLSK